MLNYKYTNRIKMDLNDLYKQFNDMPDTKPMPVVFVGHGTPMNAIEKNEFAYKWTELGTVLPRPKAILCISAHWETRGTFVTAMEHPKTIHDFYGFPRELYQQEYPAPGSPLIADTICAKITDYDINSDYEWGLDHGCWSVLKYFYPQACVPVIQLSIDHFKDAGWHYNFARELAFLRRKGVLIVGSGNMIHNLRIMRVIGDDFNAEYAYDWSAELNDILKDKIVRHDHRSMIDYRSLHKDSLLAIPTPEHYIPLLYTLALQEGNDNITIFNDKIVAGSLSMTSVLINS